MKYKNTKTGAIIETSTRVSGENWKPEIDEEPEKKKTPSKNQMADARLLANPASRSRVADFDPN